jgi:hypothetical protein
MAECVNKGYFDAYFQYSREVEAVAKSVNWLEELFSSEVKMLG